MIELVIHEGRNLRDGVESIVDLSEDDLIDAGVDCFQPLEAKAHMDIRELKPQYGARVSWMGNIDVMVLITNDRARIEAEVVSKLPIAKAGGGYIYHSDHSIAPGVRWESYQFLMELLDHYGSYA